MNTLAEPTITQIVSDALKQEQDIVTRFSWEYLHYLHRILVKQLTPVQKRLHASDFHSLVNEVVRVILNHPYSMADYLQGNINQRRERLEKHYVKVTHSVIAKKLRKSAIKLSVAPIKKYRTLIKKILGWN